MGQQLRHLNPLVQVQSPFDFDFHLIDKHARPFFGRHGCGFVNCRQLSAKLLNQLVNVNSWTLPANSLNLPLQFQILVCQLRRFGLELLQLGVALAQLLFSSHKMSLRTSKADVKLGDPPILLPQFTLCHPQPTSNSLEFLRSASQLLLKFFQLVGIDWLWQWHGRTYGVCSGGERTYDGGTGTIRNLSVLAPSAEYVKAF